MVKLRELATAALALLDMVNTGIKNNIISRAKELKPQVVSLANKFIEINTMLSKAIDIISSKYGDSEGDAVIRIEPWITISVIGDRFIVTRHKPLAVAITFVRPESKVSVLTKTTGIEISPESITLKKLGMAITVNPKNPDDIYSKVNEIKYLLREISYIVDLTTAAIEKRLGGA